MTSNLTIPGSLEWDSPEVERLTIATLRYSGGSEHDVRYVSERDYDAALAREAALREEIEMAKQVQEATDAIVTMMDGQRDRWIEKCGLLKQRLTVAEQREVDLKKLLCDVINEALDDVARLNGVKP